MRPVFLYITHRGIACLRRVDLAFQLNLTFAMFIAIPFCRLLLCESFCGIIYLIWNKADYTRMLSQFVLYSLELLSENTVFQL